jgi:hypothetical protein
MIKLSQRFSASSVNFRASSTVGGACVACESSANHEFSDGLVAAALSLAANFGVCAVINPPAIRSVGTPALTKIEKTRE